MEKRDEIPASVLAELPEEYRKKFEKIRYSAHEEGVKPSNIGKIIDGLEFKKYLLREEIKTAEKDREALQEAMKKGAVSSKAFKLLDRTLLQNKREFMDLKERIQVLRAIDGRMKIASMRHRETAEMGQRLHKFGRRIK